MGPDWTVSLVEAVGAKGPDFERRGGRASGPLAPASGLPLTAIFHVEVAELSEPAASTSGAGGSGGGEDDWPLFVRLSDGQTWGCDFVVSATGVVPVVGFLGPEYALGEDGGVVVNERMETTAGPDVLAAGDCCSMAWPQSDVWFQMRLWTQVKTRGQ